MLKSGADPKVKKTLVRNTEQKVRSAGRIKVIHEVGNASASSVNEPARNPPVNELSQPTLCSSELLANYLSGVKNSLPPPLSENDLSAGQTQMGTKITKKLNFHFNDRIYKNLVDLNVGPDDVKKRREKKPSSASSSTKRDVEPDIEDFYKEEIDIDTAPNIPVTKPKFKPIRRVEDGELHRLIASFENL